MKKDALNKYQTAEEVMKELSLNPEYQQRMADKKQRRVTRDRDLKKAEHPILEALAAEGICVDSIAHYYDNRVPVPPKSVKVLMEWLEKIENPKIQERIIHALEFPEEPYDGRPLTNFFEITNSFYDLRSMIGYTIDCATPKNVTEWVIKAVQNPSYGSSRSRLCFALIKMVPPERAIPILLAVFDQLASPCAEVLGMIGNDDSIIRFLREKEQQLITELPQKKKGTIPYHSVKGAIKDVKSAIKKIEKRMLRGQKKK